MSKEYLDKAGLTYLWSKLKAYFQVKLVSGTNIKTVNNNSLLGSGNINITGNVTGVKGNAESSYRTGNVNLTAANVGAVGKSDEMQTTNPFAPNSLRGPYISKIDNAFYAADKRWTVTSTGTGTISNLFDGSYETNYVVPSGATNVITMDFTSDPSGYFPGYPYGYILVSVYYTAKPSSISCRAYCNYEPHGIGWFDISLDPMPDNGDSNTVYRGRQPRYNISKIEFTITGQTTGTYNGAFITQIEMHLDRPDSRKNPFLSKYGEETLYYNLTAPKFIGSLAQTSKASEDACIPSKADEVSFYRATTTATGGDGHVIGFTWAGTTAYGAQLFIDTDPTYNMAIRQRNANGVWQPWKKIYTANDAINASTVNSHTVNSDVPANAKFTDTVTTATTTGSGNAVTAITATNGALSVTKGTTFLTQHQDISGKADKATTLAGYGITDAKIASGTITLGSNTITPLTSHQDISGKADKATTLAGYGITDAKIASGTITLGSNTITPLTSHQDISGKADKSATVSTVAWDSTNKKLTKTINGSTTDVVTAATLRTGLNVADGAEVNQNAFSNVTVGSTTIAADSKTDTLTLTAGSNVTLTPDATNDKITIAATDTTYESKAAASGGTAVSLVTTGEKYTWNNKSTVPTNHASSGTSYGTGTSSNYGHLKLSDSTSSTSGTSGGIAATPSAVKSAYDLANTANGTANTALSGVNGNLIYDHTFSISNGVATFTPHVYQKGAEVTTNYAASCFTWKYRLIDGSEVALTTKSNRGCDVTISNLGYGGHVIGSFTPPAS